MSNPDALLMEAMTLHRSGNFERAESSYRAVLSHDPRDYRALTLLGTLCIQRDRHAFGIKLLHRSLSINPRQPNAYNTRGNSLRVTGRFDDALASYDAALALDQGFAEAWYNRAVTLLELAQPAEALASYNKAITLNPQYARAYNNRGNIFKDWHLYEKALLDYDKALALGLEDAFVYENRADVLAGMKRYDEALASCAKASELNPADAAVIARSALILAMMKRYDDALASSERAIALDPRCAEAGLAESWVLWQLNRFGDAIAAIDRALARNPDDCHALRRNKGWMKILLGDWEEGWKLYDSWLSSSIGLRDCKKWSGDDTLTGKTVLLESDQGFGDAIQFCRYVPMVEALGAKVIIQVPAALYHLIATVSATARVILRSDPPQTFDYYCPLSSLPFAFRTTVTTVPAQTPYLGVDPSKRKQWRDRLAPRTRPRVGLVWSCGGRGRVAQRSKGGRWKEVLDSQRNIPFSVFQGFVTPGYDYYVLQKDISPEDRNALSGRPDITAYDNTLDSFADTAALASEMDIIISVDTATAHLAGALAKPVWILFPHSHGNLLALLGREHSPWYPTARIFRQTQPDDWESVICRVKTELETLRGDPAQAVS
jgi:tetratricopeptide (TPR) repeat protein